MKKMIFVLFVVLLLPSVFSLSCIDPACYITCPFREITSNPDNLQVAVSGGRLIFTGMELSSVEVKESEIFKPIYFNKNNSSFEIPYDYGSLAGEKFLKAEFRINKEYLVSFEANSACTVFNPPNYGLKLVSGILFLAGLLVGGLYWKKNEKKKAIMIIVTVFFLSLFFFTSPYQWF
ncbi:MAG: hypothetical protein HY917_02480 [Candidatus Diapherotrites archaeon]|nr:hypothetical protein [Candidatus Diapherotrites archaeon]